MKFENFSPLSWFDFRKILDRWFPDPLDKIFNRDVSDMYQWYDPDELEELDLDE
jgi:hypothetical protein